MISALKLRQDPSPHLSKLFSSEYPSAATFLVDTPTDVLPKKNRRYGVDDLDARVNEIANAIQRTAGKASLGDRICFIEAYSVAGEIGFGWWLVEHYLPYHVNRPNGCDSGEPTRGR